MSYKIRSNSNKPRGSLILGITVGVTVAFIAVFVFLSPPNVIACDGPEPRIDCGCPSNPNDVYSKNVMLIDVTDPIRATKVGDIRQLITAGAAGEENFVAWIANGKRVARTSLYLLDNKPPADSEPFAVFCSKPPTSTQFFSNASFNDIEKAQAASAKRIDKALKNLEGTASASRSPIIEGLAVYTSNASAWSSNGILVLVSDLLQNSDSCGFFENKNSIPKYGPNSLPNSCTPHARALSQNLSGFPTIAICQLPGKPEPEGLIDFWSDLFKSSANLDVALTCDWEQIAKKKNYVKGLTKGSGAG